MAFSLSFSLFFLIIVFYIVIVKLFTILFRITGLTEEVARFQVISLITNSGYTTKECELVVDVQSRRKLARFMMLFGYTFSITVISVFCNMVLSLPMSEKEEVWPVIIVVSVLFVVFIVVWRIPIVRTAMDSAMEKAGRRLLYGGKHNAVLVQDQYPSGVVASVTLNTVPEELSGKDIDDLHLPERYGIHIAFINRDGVLYIGKDSTIRLQRGDVATVLGPIKEIRRVFAEEIARKSDLPMAPKPETEEEFIHQQYVKQAAQAAEAARTAADAAKDVAGKGAPVSAAAENKSVAGPEPGSVTEVAANSTVVEAKTDGGKD